MRQVTKGKMVQKITYYAHELGLKNDEIAKKLNEEFEADETNALNAQGVAKLKKALGLIGLKPKKKALFEIIDDVEEPTGTINVEPEKGYEELKPSEMASSESGHSGSFI